MCLALSKLPKESNSVSSQAKMMLSLHVCIKNVEFYKYKIVFFAIKLIFMFAPSVQCSKKIILFLHKTRFPSCVYWMCLIWQIWYCTCCNLIAFVSFVWLPMYNRVSPNGTSVTPRYGGVGFLVYYIYDDTW